MGSACSTEPSEVIGATNEKVEEPAVTQVVDTEVYKDVFEDDNDEVDNLVQTLTASIKVDRKLQRIRLASYEAVNKVILMLDTWLSILEDVEELDLVHAHFVAMKSMVTTCSKHCFDSLDSHVLISLYRKSLEPCLPYHNFYLAHFCFQRVPFSLSVLPLKSTRHSG